MTGARCLLGFKIAALLAVTSAGISIAWLAWRGAAVVKSASTLTSDADATLRHQDAQLAVLAGKAGAILDTINRPCGKPIGDYQPCGTLAEAGVVLRKGSDLVATTQINEKKETALLDDTLPPLFDHAELAIDGLQGTSLAAMATLHATTERIDALTPIEENASHLVADLDTESGVTFSDANVLLTNPNVPILLTNFAGFVTSGNKAMFTFDAVLDKSTRDYLHPSPNPFVRTLKKVSPFVLPVMQLGGAAAFEITK